MASATTIAKTSTCWRLNPAADLVWRRWDDEYVVFNAASGDTHLLNLVAGAALRALETAPADRAQILERVAAELDLERGAGFAVQIDELLIRLDELGLIAPVTG